MEDDLDRIALDDLEQRVAHFSPQRPMSIPPGTPYGFSNQSTQRSRPICRQSCASCSPQGSSGTDTTRESWTCSSSPCASDPSGPQRSCSIRYSSTLTIHTLAN